MVFPDCKSYVDGNASLEAQFSLIRQAILSKGGLTDRIDTFRAEMGTFIQLETLLADASEVKSTTEQTTEVELPVPVVKMVKLDSGMVDDGEHVVEDANSSKLSLNINENITVEPVASEEVKSP